MWAPDVHSAPPLPTAPPPHRRHRRHPPQGYFYYIFGFAFLVAILTIIITIEVSIVCTYVQVCVCGGGRGWGRGRAGGAFVRVVVLVRAGGWELPRVAGGRWAEGRTEVAGAARRGAAPHASWRPPPPHTHLVTAAPHASRCLLTDGPPGARPPALHPPSTRPPPALHPPSTCPPPALPCPSQLCAEDYLWWWRSFYRGGSISIYVLIYSVGFLINTLHK